jgi:hypothetical protein
LASDIEGVFEGEWSSGNTLLERLAFDELHRDEGLGVDFSNLVNGADVGVAQSGGGFGFAEEAFLGFFVVEQMLGRGI